MPGQQARGLEIRQEARFVLWALRCAIAAGRGEVAADAQLIRGFEMADVAETLPEFRAFVAALASVEWSPAVWHDAGCACVSAEELLVLQAMAESAERDRGAEPAAGTGWRALVPAPRMPGVDRGARRWLAALARGGVRYPDCADLVECLRPLERMTEPARLH